MKKSHMWTKKELKNLVKLWDDSTPDEIAQEMGLEKGQVMYIVYRMRRAGIKLAKKHKTGYIDNLIKEVAKELKA